MLYEGNQILTIHYNHLRILFITMFQTIRNEDLQRTQLYSSISSKNIGLLRMQIYLVIQYRYHISYVKTNTHTKKFQIMAKSFSSYILHILLEITRGKAKLRQENIKLCFKRNPTYLRNYFVKKKCIKDIINGVHTD